MAEAQWQMEEMAMDQVRDAVALAVETLARELGCAPTEVAVAEVTPVEWPDSSLGCPRPGMMYLQVLTPGYRIRLICASREYVLHTDLGRRAVRCGDGAMERDGT